MTDDAGQAGKSHANGLKTDYEVVHTIGVQVQDAGANIGAAVPAMSDAVWSGGFRTAAAAQRCATGWIADVRALSSSVGDSGLTLQTCATYYEEMERANAALMVKVHKAAQDRRTRPGP